MSKFIERGGEEGRQKGYALIETRNHLHTSLALRRSFCPFSYKQKKQHLKTISDAQFLEIFMALALDICAF